MSARITVILGPDDPDIQRAADCLRRGGLVAFPTETVYGLGAHALNPGAVRQVFAAKGRPANDPLIVHVATIEQVDALTTGLPDSARALASRFWPGPLTMVLRRGASVPLEVTAGLDTVAVRIPVHPIARALLQAAEIPIAAPSANLFSRPSPTTAAHVLHDLDGRIDMVIDGGPTPVGVESTVIDLTSREPRVLRPGGVSLEALRHVLPVVHATPRSVTDDEAAESPGLLSQHYSPRTPMTLYSGSLDASRTAVIERIRHASAQGKRVGLLATSERCATFEGVPVVVADLGPEDNPEEIARRLYASVRTLDDAGLDLILALAMPRTDGLWLAINDRLARAATEHVTVQ